MTAEIVHFALILGTYDDQKYVKDRLIIKLKLKQKGCAYIRKKVAFILILCYRFYEIGHFPGVGGTADKNYCSWTISQGSFFNNCC